MTEKEPKDCRDCNHMKICRRFTALYALTMDYNFTEGLKPVKGKLFLTELLQLIAKHCHYYQSRQDKKKG